MVIKHALESTHGFVNFSVWCKVVKICLKIALAQTAYKINTKTIPFQNKQKQRCCRIAQFDW